MLCMLDRLTASIDTDSVPPVAASFVPNTHTCSIFSTKQLVVLLSCCSGIRSESPSILTLMPTDCRIEGVEEVVSSFIIEACSESFLETIWLYVGLCLG